MAKKKTTSPSMPKEIFAQVSPKSIGGRSLFEAGEYAVKETVQNFLSEKDAVLHAVEDLKKAGFNVLQVTNTTINISGSATTFEKAFGTTIHAREVESMKSGAEEDMITILDTAENDVTGLIVPKSGTMANYIEGVAIETPYYYFAPKRFPPKKAYWHLNVPGDVSLALNADKAHRAGITGKNVHVAMVDSGFYRHPFFSARGYRVNQTVVAPGATNGLVDTSGHGTGESANIFAAAPDVRLTPVKMSFVNTTAAFNAAVARNPDIITCSWGSDKRVGPLSAANQALAAAIAGAVARGIIVVFSAGNGHWGFPGQHPDVISAGGVYMDQNLNLRASNYSSGFNSNIYSGRTVPDVCGLVGQQPGANYIMLPLQEGSDIDRSKAGGTHPNGDETAATDGWAAFSGTSAAAPQLAGVAALIKQSCPRLTPSQVKNIMKATAKDVTTGRSHSRTGGNASVTGPDNSTGHGLVNAYRAAIRAKLGCRRPIRPIPPLTPILPINPIPPIQPINPIRPIIPVGPVIPVVPVNPLPPIPPIGPVINMDDFSNESMDDGANFVEPDQTFLSEEEIDEVMDMLEEGTLDIDEI